MSDETRPAPARRLVDPPWRDALARALDVAERSVASFYAIRPREWASRFRYDLASAADHPALNFAPGTMAQIVALEIAASSRPPRWRIVLRDAVVFRLARRHGLDNVLAYALSHELVHLVRFASGLAVFDETSAGHRDEEERKVSRIAAEALAPALGPAARPALEALSGGAAPHVQRARRGTGANPV